MTRRTGMRLRSWLFWIAVAGLLSAPVQAGAVLSKTVEITAVSLAAIQPEDGSDFPLARGSSTSLTARISPADAAGLDVDWQIIEEGKDPGVKVSLRASGSVNERATLTAAQDSADGAVTIQASLRQAPSISRRVRVRIGCSVCAEGFCDAFVRLSSVEFELSLGKARRGRPAGDLYLSAKQLTSETATPAALRVSVLNEEVGEVKGADGSLRQVVAPEKFIDIVTVSPYAYEVRVYAPSARGAKASGVYTVAAGATPRETWRIENPDAASGPVSRLRLSKLDSDREYEFSHDAAAGGWSLASGGGLQVRSRTERTEGSDRIVTEVLRDDQGRVASVERTTWRSYPWGEEVVEQVVDPDGAALTTTSSYHETAGQPGYGRLAVRVEADGSWVRYAYDAEGRVVREVRPWLDAATDAPESAARVTIDDYTPVDPQDARSAEDADRPRTVTEQVLGVAVARTYSAWLVGATTGERTQIVERAATPGAAYGSAGNERTVTVSYPVNAVEASSGLTKSILTADGRLDGYVYEFGTYTTQADPGLSTFVAGAGNDVRETVTHGSAAHPGGILFQSTREVMIRDAAGRELLRETQLRTESGYERLGWTATSYDERGRQTGTVDSTGRSTSAAWDCCGKISERDAQGVVRSYQHDGLQRVAVETIEAWPSTRTGSSTYDAAGRVLTRTTASADLMQTSATSYDGAGRLLSATDEAGLTTAYAYEDGGRRMTVTRPGGGTEVTERHLDGRTRAVTGTAVVAQHFEYGVNADGTQWTRTAVTRADSPLWERTTTDALGRTVLVERPGPLGVEVAGSAYDERGLLRRTNATGMADTLYEYDELGRQTRSGLDVDGSGALETASDDRITETETRYVLDGGAWWQESVRRVYATAGVVAATVVGTGRVRESGFAGAGVVAETVSADAHGNRTRSWTVFDAGTGTETRNVTYPDSDTTETQTTRLGVLTSSTSKTGVTTTFAYDGLGRRTGVTDARTGSSLTHYDSQGRVDYVEDAAGNRTRYGYEALMGRKIMETDPLGRVTRYAYDTQGRLTHTWGDAPYPVRQEYDSYGRLLRMTMWRVESGWTGLTWPADPGPGDMTTWEYDEGTGLLVAKRDAAGRAVTYTYGAQGRLASRTWARRTAAGDPIVTTYAYSPVTGELLSVQYSDETADVTYTYDRLGRLATVTDAVGTRSHTYAGLDPLDEQMTGLVTATLTRRYEEAPAGVPGRSAGLSVVADYEVTYGYDTKGRMDEVSWAVAGQSGNLAYTHLAGTDLLSGRAYGTGLTSSYEYEAHRDLRTSVSNAVPDGGGVPGGPGGPGGPTTDTVSLYRYAYDAAGRRTSVTNEGRSYPQAAYNRYDYDARSQLADSRRYLGTNVDDPSQPVPSWRREYEYDPIGNRETATIAETAHETYTTNALNQYEQVASDGGGVVALEHDEDGNVTRYEPAGVLSMLTWDAENRLVAVDPATPSVGDMRSRYRYDYLGRRIGKVVEVYEADGTWSASEARRFVYDGWNLVRELDESGLTVASYVWGLDLSGTLQGAGGIGGLTAMIAGGATYQYLYDANGNVTEVLNPADPHDAYQATYRYDPYGNLIARTGPLGEANRFRYSTKYYDEETDLYYYGYRYYSPELGRWLSRDPLEELGAIGLRSTPTWILNRIVNIDIGTGRPRSDHAEMLKARQRIGLYLFAQNKPTVLIDPLGLTESCGSSCTDGEWFVDQRMGSTAALGIGVSRTKVKLSCLSSARVCEGVMDCTIMGLIANVGWNVLNLDAHEPLVPSKIGGCYRDIDLDYHTMESTFISAGPFTFSSSGIGIGPSFGGGIAKSFCHFNLLVCR